MLCVCLYLFIGRTYCVYSEWDIGFKHGISFSDPVFPVRFTIYIPTLTRLGESVKDSSNKIHEATNL